MGYKFKGAKLSFPKKSGVLSEKETNAIARKIKSKTDGFSKKVMKHV